MPQIPYTSVEPAPQAAYRMIMLGPNGDVLATEPLAAGNDDEASEMARAKATEFAVELWDGLRFIEHFQAGEEFLLAECGTNSDDPA